MIEINVQAHRVVPFFVHLKGELQLFQPAVGSGLADGWIRTEGLNRNSVLMQPQHRNVSIKHTEKIHEHGFQLLAPPWFHDDGTNQCTREACCVPRHNHRLFLGSDCMSCMRHIDIQVVGQARNNGVDFF